MTKQWKNKAERIAEIKAAFDEDPTRTASDVARIVGISKTRISQLVPHYRKRVTKTSKILEMNSQGMSPRDIQSELGIRHLNYIYNTLARFNQSPGYRATSLRHDRRRGFAVPLDRRAEYQALRKLGLTTEECGWEMGLLERPKMGAKVGWAGRDRGHE